MKKAILLLAFFMTAFVTVNAGTWDIPPVVTQYFHFICDPPPLTLQSWTLEAGGNTDLGIITPNRTISYSGDRYVVFKVNGAEGYAFNCSGSVTIDIDGIHIHVEWGRAISSSIDWDPIGPDPDFELSDMIPPDGIGNVYYKCEVKSMTANPGALPIDSFFDVFMEVHYGS